MEIKTAKVSGIRIAGSSIRVGGQMVMAADKTFKKALTSSVDGEQEEAAEQSIEQNLDPAELLQYKKLPSWTRRRCQRLLNNEKAKEDFWIEAGENVTAPHVRSGNPPAGSNGSGMNTGGEGVAKAGNAAWKAKENMGQPGKAGWLAGEGASKMGSAGWLAGEGASKVGSAVWKAGKGAKKGAAAAAGVGASIATAGTAAPAVAAGKAAKGAVQSARMAKRAADHVRSSLAATSGQQHMEIKLAVEKQRKEEQGKKKKRGETFRILLWALLAGAALFFIIFMNIFVLLFTNPRQGTEASEAHNLVEAAQAELTVSDSDIGGYKYKRWYGMDADWCAMFVSYCANQCGYIESGVMPKTASVSEMKNWYQSRGLYHDAAGYVPMPGDIIFFGNGKSHTGIVTGYDPKKQVVTTIEGNTGTSDVTPYHMGSRVKECHYAAGYDYIVGYGSPEYPLEDSPTEDSLQPAQNDSET